MKHNPLQSFAQRGGGIIGCWVLAGMVAAVVLLSACNPVFVPAPTVDDPALLQPDGVEITSTPAPSDGRVAPMPAIDTPVIVEYGDEFAPAGWSADGQLLGIARRSAEFLVDSSGNELAQAQFSEAEYSIFSPLLSPNGQLVALQPKSRGEIQIWYPAGSGVYSKVETAVGSIDDLVFSPDSRLLGVGTYDGEVSVVDVSGCATETDPCGEHLRTIQAHAPGMTRVHFSPDASLVASEGEDRAIHVWRTDDGSLVRTFQGQGVAFSPDGQSIAFQGRGETLRVYRIDDGTLSLAFSNPGLKELVFSPDGRYLAWSYGQTIHLAELGSEVVVHDLERPEWIYDLAFVPDGAGLTWDEWGQAVLWPVAMLLASPASRPAMVESNVESDIRTATVDLETLLDLEQGGSYISGLIDKYELSSIIGPFVESYTVKEVGFSSGASGVLVHAWGSIKAPSFLFLFREENGRARLVDWVPGPNGILKPDLFSGSLPDDLDSVDLFPVESNHGYVLKAYGSGSAGTGLGSTQLTLFEVAEDRLIILFDATQSQFRMGWEDGELSRSQFEYTDLDGDDIKEIIEEGEGCIIVKEDDGWEIAKSSCSGFPTQTYSYDGTKYVKVP
ncbi:MAG: PD40 domain-containing protein [Anaerolineae bacterium]|nr:PD40 domain-containing protein [Anaerolineae bacterium]